MCVREHNYWLTTVGMPTADAAYPLPENVDVAVIGAGYTGLSAARTLAKNNARVAVLEAETIGWGASSRNGGMVLTGLKLGVTKLISMYGRERTQRMYAASLASIDCVEQIVAEEAIECSFSRCGHLEVACKQKHFDDYSYQAEVIAREFNHSLRIVPKDELRTEIGSDIYFGGMVDEVSAGLNPAQYVAGLARAAQNAGAAVFERARVEKLESAFHRGTKGWKVSTARGVLWARDVFVGTSGYTGSVTPGLKKKIIPIGSYIIATEVLPQTIRESAEILRRGMIQVYPRLRDTKVEYVWGGTLDFAFDIMPHAGQLAGIYFAVGYAGHGVAMATYQGQKIAEWIVGGKNDNPFAGIPFPGAPLGLYNGTPWFLPLAGAWYKFLDWVS